MSGFGRNSEGGATLGAAPIADLVGKAGVLTPVYVYDLDGIAQEVNDLVTAFDGAPHLVAYAVKANSAGSILRAVAAAGGGADVVSGGELDLVLRCSVSPDRVVMSGVAKTDAELDRAIAASIRAVQIESLEEIDRIAARARAAKRTARVALRVNPSVVIDSHAHVATGHDDAKFGIPMTAVSEAWARVDAFDELEAVGVSVHVGSMLCEVEPYLASARVVCDTAQARMAAGHSLSYVDFGGGFGIDYGQGPAKPPRAFARAALGLLRERGLDDLQLVLEPGRSIVGPHGVLVASVIQSKIHGERRWVLLDAAMNDLLRPALYGTHHRIEPLDRVPAEPKWRVAGPVCESADDFGAHPLGQTAPPLVVIRDTGAYGFVMASEYNGRPRPAEVFAAGGEVRAVSPSAGVDPWVAGRLGA